MTEKISTEGAILMVVGLLIFVIVGLLAFFTWDSLWVRVPVLVFLFCTAFGALMGGSEMKINVRTLR